MVRCEKSLRLAVKWTHRLRSVDAMNIDPILNLTYQLSLQTCTDGSHINMLPNPHKRNVHVVYR